MEHHHHKHRHPPIADADLLRQQFAHQAAPVGPTADAYRLVGYTNELVGTKNPECLPMMARYDSGVKWPDPNNPLPTDFLWGGGVRAGLPWDGMFYRDVTRYPAGGQLFWSPYLKPGSGPGLKNGYWFNFGKGFCHLANDDPAQMLTGACSRLEWGSTGHWKLVIDATAHVTAAVVNVWTGTKQGGNDPVGDYTRITGCDPLAMLTVEAG